MKQFVTIPVVLLTILLMCACSDSAAKKKLLVGTWKASETDQTGRSTDFILTFNEHDKGEWTMFVRHPEHGAIEARWTFTYEIQANNAITTIEDLYLNALIESIRETIEGDYKKTRIPLDDLENGEINIPSNSYGTIRYTKSG